MWCMRPGPVDRCCACCGCLGHSDSLAEAAKHLYAEVCGHWPCLRGPGGGFFCHWPSLTALGFKPRPCWLWDGQRIDCHGHFPIATYTSCQVVQIQNLLLELLMTLLKQNFASLSRLLQAHCLAEAEASRACNSPLNRPHWDGHGRLLRLALCQSICKMLSWDLYSEGPDLCW